MGRSPDGCAPPENRRCGTEHQLNPDAGDGGRDALPLAGIDVDLGDIHEKARFQVVEQESHLVNCAAEMLAGETVGGFVEEAQETKQQPEFKDVGESLLGEVVVLPGVGANLTPTVNENDRHDDEECESQVGEPPGVDEPHLLVEVGQVVVRVPMSDEDRGNVLPFLAGTLVATVCFFFRRGGIRLVWRDVPDVVEVADILAYLVRGKGHARSLFKKVGHLLVRTLSVEKLHQLPLHGCEAIELVGSGNDRVDDGLPILDVITDDEMGMEPRMRAVLGARGRSGSATCRASVRFMGHRGHGRSQSCPGARARMGR